MTALRAAGVIAALAIGCGPAEKPPAAPLSPPLSLTLPALDGGTIDLAAYRGEVILLHAFATWSPAALHDARVLADVAAAHPDDVRVIAIAMDTAGYRMVSAWRNAADVRYLIGLATDAIRGGQTALGDIRQIPITFVIDRRGRIVERLDGAIDPEALNTAVAPLLGPGELR